LCALHLEGIRVVLLAGVEGRWVVWSRLGILLLVEREHGWLLLNLRLGYERLLLDLNCLEVLLRVCACLERIGRGCGERGFHRLVRGVLLRSRGVVGSCERRFLNGVADGISRRGQEWIS